MSRYLSPLRYPGGKASIAPALLEDIDAEVGRVPVRYCGSSSRIAEELLIRPSLSAADSNHRDKGRS